MTDAGEDRVFLSRGTAPEPTGMELLLARIVGHTADRLGCVGGSITLLGADGDDPATVVRHHRDSARPEPVTVDAVGLRAARERRTVIDPAGPVLGTPLWWAGEVLGACVLAGDGHDFSDADLATAELSACHAAIAVATARELRPDPAGGFADVVRAEVGHVLGEAGPPSQVVAVGSGNALDPGLRRQALRVLREALENAAEHSGADSVRVGVVFAGDTVSLIVEDDGRGFDPVTVTGEHGEAARTGRFGLHGMAARVHRLGGVLDLDSTPGWGTRVRVRLPTRPEVEVRARRIRGASPTATGSHTELTLREREVRELVEQGLADKQIATRLSISVKTVEKHVGAVLRKTGARNRTMLARLAVADAAGWTSPEGLGDIPTACG